MANPEKIFCAQTVEGPKSAEPSQSSIPHRRKRGRPRKIGVAETAAPDLFTQPIKNEFRRALSVRHFREMFDIGPTKAWELISSGQVKSFKLGKKRLIDAESAEALFRKLAGAP